MAGPLPIPYLNEGLILAKALKELIGGGGGVKDMIGEQAKAIAQVMEARATGAGYLVMPVDKLEKLRKQHPDLAADLDLTLERDHIAPILLMWLLQVGEKFDNPKK